MIIDSSRSRYPVLKKPMVNSVEVFTVTGAEKRAVSWGELRGLIHNLIDVQRVFNESPSDFCKLFAGPDLRAFY